MRNIKQLKNIKGKTVLVRVDFNVPISDGKVEDNFRIKKGIPTILYLLGKGAKVKILMHLGKDGTSDINPVIKEFFRISKISKKDVEFLPNVRSYKGEEENSKELAKEFAKTGDIYVNDAFSVSHREHSSVVGIPKFLPSYAGFQLMEEVKNLSIVFDKPKHPFLFILGGAKFSTKMPLIKKYLKLADYVFVGGALANDFLKAKGFEVGDSLLDEEGYDIKSILKNKKLLLPIDVVVKNQKGFVNKNSHEVNKGESILDIGAMSVKSLEEYIKKSKLILWNGPLGRYETGGGDSTKSILRSIAKTKTTSIIGGGDTVALISQMKMEKDFTFVSTGGGATLDFLAKGTLPGIKVLK
ncbi:MAG: phosphoglycerate kinase [Candidatus Nomurabacteria bacterium]|nr:phosphoglycerate kinase [Candidatus Nomurabacteria bacterium]